MSEYEFLSAEIIKEFIENSEELENTAIYLTNGFEILFLHEQFNKGNLKFQTFNDFFQCFNNFINNGSIFSDDFDKERLENTLFIDNDEIIKIDEKICNKKVSPRYTFNMLYFKPDNTTIWDNDFYLKVSNYDCF